MVDIATLGLEVRSDGVVVASDRLNKFGRDAARAERSADSLGSAFRRFAPIIGTITAALSARALKSYADGWSDAQSRVGAAVKNMEAAPALMERIVDVANASYSPLAQTVEIFGRNVVTLRDFGRSATEAADFTESLNHALVTTATKGQDADIVLNSLSRAISNNKMRTMEFETIMSRSPRVLEAIADHLNTNVTGLRALAAQGKVTGDAMVSGIIKSLEQLREEAGAMPATIGDAMVRLDTNFGALVGRVDQATGMSESFAQSLIWVADTMRAWADDIVRAALVVQTGFNAALEAATSVVSSLAGSFDAASWAIVAGAGAAGIAVTALTAAIAGGLINALVALSVALAANPFALFIGAISAAVTASYLFRDEIAEIVGVDVFSVFREAANTIINMMVGAYRAVVAVWEHLPGQFGRIGKLAANALLDALGGIEISWTNPFTGKTHELFNLDLSSLKIKVDEAESYVAGVASAAYRAEQGIDRVGQAAEGLRETWRSVDGAVAAFEGLATAGGKAVAAFDPKAAKEAQKAAKAYKKIVEGAQQFIDKHLEEIDIFGMTEQAANAYRYELDMLHQAQSAGIKLTEAQRIEIAGLAEDMAATEAAAKALKSTQDAYNEAANSGGSWLRGLIDRTKDWRQALLDLIPVVLKLMNSLNIAGGGKGIFGGGAFQSFMGGLLGIGFQSGGFTGAGAPSTPAGIVHAGEYVMSKSAVDRLGVGYLDALHNAAKGYQMGGYVRAQSPANVNMRGYQAGGYVPRAPQYGNTAERLDIYVHAEEGKMFRPVVRAEAQGVAVQVTQAAAPGIMQGSAQTTQQAARNRPGFFR